MSSWPFQACCRSATTRSRSCTRAVKSRHCGFTRPACSLCHPRMASRSRESGMGILLVLENPTGTNYSGVKARLRFQNADECAVLADQFARVPAPGLRGWIGARWTDLGELLLGTRALAPPDCGTNERWSTFDVPSFARVSIRAATLPGGSPTPKAVSPAAALARAS